MIKITSAWVSVSGMVKFPWYQPKLRSGNDMARKDTQFKKGNPGRPKGSKNKITVDYLNASVLQISANTYLVIPLGPDFALTVDYYSVGFEVEGCPL